MLEHCEPAAIVCQANRFGQIGWARNSTAQETLVETFNDPSSVNRYGQEDCDNYRHKLALECENGAAAPEAVGSYSYYAVLWNYVSGFMTYYVNGREVARSTDAFVPTLAVATTEVQDAADQIAGDPEQPEIFDDLHVFVRGRWVPMHGKMITDPTLPYGGFAMDPDGLFFGTWDLAFGDATYAYRRAQQAHDRTAVSKAMATPASSGAVLGARARVSVSCPAGARSCAGTLELLASQRARASRSQARSMLAVPTEFAVPPGIRTTVAMRLTAFGRHFVRRRRFPPATVIVASPDGASRARAVKLGLMARAVLTVRHAGARSRRQIRFDATKSSGVGGPIVTYRWYFGDGGGAAGRHVTHRYRRAGIFIVRLRIRDKSGHRGFATRRLEVGR